MNLISFRPKEVQDNLLNLLKERGINCINLPIVEVKGLLNLEEVKKSLEDPYDFIIFTSQIGVLMVKEALKGNLKAKVIAIGPETLNSLKSLGIPAECISKDYNTRSLALSLVKRGVKGKRILLFRSKNAEGDLEEILEKAGAKTKTLRTHELIPSERVKEAVNLVLREDTRGLIFTSPFIVKVLMSHLGSIEGKLIFSIGPSTSRALRSFGVKEIYEAKESTSKGLLEIILKVLL